MGGGAPQHTTTLTFAQENLAKTLGKKIQSGLDQGPSVKPYGGKLVADMTPAQQQLQGQIQSFDPTATNQQAQNSLSQLLSGQQVAGGNLGEDATNKLYQQSIFNPMMHTFQTQVAPQIKQAFAGAGRSFSSQSGFAQERALSDMNVAGQAQLGNAVFQNQQLQAQYQNDAYQRQLAGLSLAPQIGGMAQQQQAAQQQLLAPYQQQQQALLNANYQRWTTAQPYNNPYIALANQYIGEGQSAVYQPQMGAGSAIVNSLIGQAGSLGVSSALGTGGSNIAALLGIGAGASSGIAGISAGALGTAATSAAAAEATGSVASIAPFALAALA